MSFKQRASGWAHHVNAAVVVMGQEINAGDTVGTGRYNFYVSECSPNWIEVKMTDSKTGKPLSSHNFAGPVAFEEYIRSVM
jgi:hypothetical protein